MIFKFSVPQVVIKTCFHYKTNKQTNNLKNNPMRKKSFWN